MKAARAIYGLCAVVFGGLALVAGYYAVTLPWAPRIDFDVIGFLWLLQNLPRLTAWVLTAVFGVAAIYAAVRSATA